MLTGYDKNRERIMKQIMALDFTLNELVLFLDTHPDHPKALEKYHKIAAQSKELRKFYKENFGPLTNAEVTSTTDWTWIKSPWPWEN